jgi:hypothetical protein
LMIGMNYLGRARVDFIYLMANFLIPATLGAAGIFLFTRAPRLGRRLLPRVAIGDLEQSSHGPTQLHAMALSIVGLLLFVWSAPGLMWLILSLLIGDNGRAIQRTLASRVGDSAPPLLTNGVQAALGVWLFLGSKGLAAWWGRLRHPEFHGPDSPHPDAASPSGDDAARID